MSNVDDRIAELEKSHRAKYFKYHENKRNENENDPYDVNKALEEMIELCTFQQEGCEYLIAKYIRISALNNELIEENNELAKENNELSEKNNELSEECDHLKKEKLSFQKKLLKVYQKHKKELSVIDDIITEIKSDQKKK